MAQKLLFWSTAISADILVRIVGYSFCTEHDILGTFCQMLLPLKRQRLSAQKLLCFGIKNVGEIDNRLHHWARMERVQNGILWCTQILQHTCNAVTS
jgi:hypothetical protein